ncbi:MAG: nuclear transport factor 2 family protein [Bacteroidota bacterium]
MNTIKFMLLAGLGIWASITSAQDKSEAPSNKQIVQQFLEGFNDPTKIHASLELLADDYHFSNPVVSLTSKEAFIGLAQQIGEALTGVNILRMSQQGEWVAVWYEFTSDIPGVESNMATEWFRLESGKIKESCLIYDASEWRKVYARMQE